MTLSENQPKNQDTAGQIPGYVFGHQWRNVLTDSGYELLDSFRLLPLVGKNPQLSAWNTVHMDRAAVNAWRPEPNTWQQEATGFGIITGPQWPGPASRGSDIPVQPRPEGATSLICFDFDGPSARQWLESELGGTLPHTWMITRRDSDSNNVPGRGKLVFLTTPEQSEQLGGLFICKQVTAEIELKDGKKKQEALEVFHTRGKQIAVLGDYPQGEGGGEYFWLPNCGPNALAQLPQELFDIALRINANYETAKDENRKHQARKAESHSSKIPGLGGGQWRVIRDRPCPICGRNKGHICSQHTSGAIRCFNGDSFGWRSQHGERIPSGHIIETIEGAFAFCSANYDGPAGAEDMGNFVVHKPKALKPRDLGAYADADNAAAAITVDNILALPPISEIQQQAADPYSTDALLAEIERIHAEMQRLGFDSLYETSETRAMLHQLQRRVAGEQARHGRKNTAVQQMVLQCFGIKQTAWFEELKPLVAEAHAAAADLERQRRVERFAEAAMQLTADWDGNTAPTPLQAVNLWTQAVGPWRGEQKERPSNQALLDAITRSLDAYGARYNTMTQSIDLLTESGVVAVVPPEIGDQLNMHLAKLGWEVDQRPMRQAIAAALVGRAYNPVADWLETIANDPTIEPIDLGSVASDCLGVHDDLSREMVRRWLIGAVARALNPGCRMEAVLILKSEKQGLGKSTFARCLCPPLMNADGTPSEMHLWFTNNASIGSDADSKLTMHCGWVIELQEMERFSSKRSTEELKTCITTANDLVRPPYGSAHVQMPRASVLIGTCNTEGFLPRDPTGTRRFWPIDLDNGTGTSPEHVESWLTANRQGLWKAAMQAYRNGERWHLTTEQEQERHKVSMDYMPDTAQDDDIAAWIASKPHNVAFQIQTAAWNSGAYNRDRDKLTPNEQQAIAALLRQLGFTKQRGPKVIGRAGRKPMLWMREEYVGAAKAQQWDQLKVLSNDPDEFIRQQAERRQPWPG